MRTIPFVSVPIKSWHRTLTVERSLFSASILHTKRLFLPLLILGLSLIPSVALAQSNQNFGEVCFAVADEFDPGNLARDTLTSLNLVNGNTQIIDTVAPAGTGTVNIEAISFGPNHQLFAADGGQLGILDPATGSFTALAQPFGSGTGSLGANPISFNDSDGLAYSLVQNIFFGTRRRFDAPNPAPGDQLQPDLLFAINPVTGAHIPDFFGSGKDYIVVQPVNDDDGNPLPDLDDIQFNPVDGKLYGVMNAGGRDGVLVTIDVATGIPTRLATLRYANGEIIDDVEGISFTNDGTLYASTGDNFDDPNDRNRLYRITNPAIGLGELVAPFPVGPKDYEGLACLYLEASIVLKKYTNGPGQVPQDADEPQGPQIDEGAQVTWTYIFTNTGILTLTNLSLIDNRLGAVAPPSSCIPAGTILPPGQSLTCTATGIAQSGQYSNIGTITGNSVAIPLFSSRTVSDTDPSHYFGKSLDVNIEPLCILDAPYISYTVSANFPTNPNPVTLRWLDVDDNKVLYELTGLPAVNQILWPEAAVDENGRGIAWPGWSFDEANHVWVDNGSSLRPKVKVEITVNPTEVITVDYPPATPTCSAAPSSLATVGDFVWLDVNKNSLQDPGEPGIPNVEVRLYSVATNNTEVTSADVSASDQLVLTTTTNAEGLYGFTDLQPGSYYLVFGTVPGYASARYDINGNSQDERDSDPRLPFIAVSISDGDIVAELGKPVTYTLSFTNTDLTTEAQNLVFSMTVPAGTTFVPQSSDPNWQCTGQNCSLTIPSLLPNTTESRVFTVLLDEDDANVPDVINVVVNVTNGTVARTGIVTLEAGEADLTIDAGYEPLQTQSVGADTPIPNDPTSLPPNEQPQDGATIFLPSLQRQE